MKKTLLLLMFLLAEMLHAQNASFLDGSQEISNSLRLAKEAQFRVNNIFRGGTFTSGDSARFQSVLKKVLTDSNDIGLVAGITDDRDARWSGAENHPAVSQNAKMKANYVFGIGSNTKSITSAAILLLMEDGKLTLEDKLSKWLHNYKNVDPDITIRQCLQMTSGIYNFTDHPNFFAAISANPTKIWTPEEVLTTFVGKPLFNKGTSWKYSNTNYVLLGLIIEKASGMAYKDFVRSRIIEPLGLSSFSYYPHEAPTAPMAHAWADINQDKIPDDLNALGFSLKSFFSAAGAAGAYLATAQDLSRWNHALFTGQLLQPSSLAEMKKEYKLNNSSGYGLGILVLHTSGGNLFGHNGSIIYQSLVYYQPDLGVSISAITNNIHDVFSLTPVFNGLLSEYLSIITAVEKPFLPQGEITLNTLFHSDLKIQYNRQEINQCSIYKMSTGRQLYNNQSMPTGELVVPTRKWSSGMYIIQLLDKQGKRQTLKAIKW